MAIIIVRDLKQGVNPKIKLVESVQLLLTLGLRELRSHRHRRALLNLLAALFSGFGSFQSWITTNEDGGNRADGASNEGEEVGKICTQELPDSCTLGQLLLFMTAYVAQSL